MSKIKKMTEEEIEEKIRQEDYERTPPCEICANNGDTMACQTCSPRNCNFETHIEI